jgi:hypothetical protein
MGTMKLAAVLLLAALVGCAPRPEDRDPDAVAQSLFEATRTICVPNMVDGVARDKLVRRADLSKRVDNVRGVAVTRFNIDAPGRPDVTLTDDKDLGIDSDGHHHISDASCWILVRTSPEVARQVIPRLRQRLLTFKPYGAKPAQDVEMASVMHMPDDSFGVCIRSRKPALVGIGGPEYKDLSGEVQFGYVEIHVLTDALALASESCG